MFFIDGEEYPSLNGTGTEDYFNHAWGMQRKMHIHSLELLYMKVIRMIPGILSFPHYESSKI